MELVIIATGEPITRAEIEAAWIAAQPATVTVKQPVTVERVVTGEDAEGNPTEQTIFVEELVDVEIDNHVEFPLPDDLTDVDLSSYGAVQVEPVDPPVPGPGESVDRDGIEAAGPGRWCYKYAIRSLTAGEFDAHETVLLSQVDSQAGAFRTRFMTDVPGQQQTYAEKEREARAFLLDPDGDYVFLTAEANARENCKAKAKPCARMKKNKPTWIR